MPELMHLFTLPDHMQESSILFRLTERTIGSGNGFRDVSLLRSPVCPMTYVEVDILVIWVLGTVENASQLIVFPSGLSSRSHFFTIGGSLFKFLDY